MKTYNYIKLHMSLCYRQLLAIAILVLNLLGDAPPWG